MAWWRASHHVMKLYLATAACATIVIPLLLSEYGYSLLHAVLAVLLVDVCFYPTARYFARKESGIPTMAVFCGAYAFQFALPVFTRDANIQLAHGEVENLRGGSKV